MPFEDDEEDSFNWLRNGPNPLIEERAQLDEEYAAVIEEHFPDLYYSWEWTEDPPKGD